MTSPRLLKIESLTELHTLFGLAKPNHPLISVIRLENVRIKPATLPDFLVLNVYKIVYKTELLGRAKYGQTYYDFGEGGLVFTAPNQPFESPDKNQKSGYLLLVHPDFLLASGLAKTIKQYGFFSYAVNEALHLSENEKVTIIQIVTLIETELKSRIDEYSQPVGITQLELLLTYADRYYNRQFITRQAVNYDLLRKLEEVLDDYFRRETSLQRGLPSVRFLAGHVNLSPSYLSDMLRSLIGQNAQQYIHDKLIEKAKEQLATTHLSVSEVAYALGFEHAQSFSKLFKSKTNLSPLAFRQSFN